MKLTVLGAASVAAIALVACAKKDEAKTADAVPPAAEAAAPDAVAPDITEVAPEASDVYASAAVDLASLRSKEALTVATDTAFAQADADADGSLSLTEFYSLASIMAPAPAADAAVETAIEAAADVVGEVAGEPTGEAAASAAGEIVAEEPTQDAAALDASFATIAGADAALSTDDLRAAFLSRFDAADANLDGSLDDAEAEAFKAAGLF